MILDTVNNNSYRLPRPVYSRTQVANRIISLDEINDSISLKSILTIDFLRELNLEPVVHGNGFVLLSITPRTRLHIWGHPEIPQKEQSQSIHDHVYGFRSFALVGKLKSIRYELDFNNNDYQIYFTNPDRLGIEPTNVFCSIRQKDEVTIAPYGNNEGLPDFYDIKPWDIHINTVDGIAATVIHKTGFIPRTQNNQGQRSMCLLPRNGSPYSVTARAEIDKKLLWRIVEEVLNLK